VGYGALIAAELEAEAAEEDDGDEDDEDDGGMGLVSGRMRGLRRWWKRVDDTWVNPKAGAVRRAVDVWWSRWGVLVVLPASLVGCPFSFLFFSFLFFWFVLLYWRWDESGCVGPSGWRGVWQFRD
jgi:hypothetical protein